MYLFSYSQMIRDEYLVIPYEMRAALGFHKGCLVSLSQTSKAPTSLDNQILISSIPLEKRQDFWNLKACFRDRPGILTELTEFLMHFDIDIWDCSVATRNQNSEFVVSLGFDAQLYKSMIDMDSSRRKQLPRAWLQELYARIVCHFIHDLALRPDGKPNIYLKRNHLLSNSVENLKHRGVAEIKKDIISIPKTMLTSIRSSFSAVYDIDKKEAILGMLVADPEFKALILTVFFRHTGHVHLRLEANNQVGTIAIVSKALFDHGFNILQAYTRNLHVAERSRTDLFLHLPPNVDKERNDNKLRRFIRGIFRNRELRKLDCNIQFPPPYRTNRPRATS